MPLTQEEILKQVSDHQAKQAEIISKLVERDQARAKESGTNYDEVMSSQYPMSRGTQKLMERNARRLKKALLENEDMKEFRETMRRTTKRLFNVDMDPVTDEKRFPVENEDWSWKKFSKKLTEAASMREGDVGSAFVQYFRAGIQQVMNAGYKEAETSFEKLVTVVTSDKRQELYPINYGIAFPKQVGRNEKAPEVGSVGLDLSLQNLEYGTIYEVEKRAIEDDKLGAFQNNVKMLGTYMKLLQEVLVQGKVASVSNMKYIDFKIPKSETKPSDEANWPWSTSFVGGGKNRLATFKVLNQGSLQELKILSRQQKNPLGIFMQADPNVLHIGPAYSFDARVLLNSTWYPSGAAATGQVGGAFAVNALKGMFDLSETVFMFKNDGSCYGDSYAWYIIDNKKPGFILQVRQPAFVTQEDPNAGRSFDFRVYRYQANASQNADWFEPRWWFQGNDGSAVPTP